MAVAGWLADGFYHSFGGAVLPCGRLSFFVCLAGGFVLTCPADGLRTMHAFPVALLF